MSINTSSLSLDQYPEFLKPQDLIKLGIFVNRVALYRSRLKYKDTHPPHFLVGKRVRYLKSELIKWLNKA
jgi:hypothetical protein